MSRRGSEPSLPESDRVIAIGRATLRSVDFRKARFDRFVLSGALFLVCDFRDLRLDARFRPLFAARPRSVFRDCRFDGADLRRVHPGASRFEGCTFDDARLDGWKTRSAEFVGCRFAGSLGQVAFQAHPTTRAERDAGRSRNEFRGNDFVDADMDDITFIGRIDLEAQRLPLGDDLIRIDRLHYRITLARREVRAWNYPEERSEALAMLRALSVRHRDQHDIIAPRVSKRGPSPRVQVRVWALLERVR